MMRLDSKMNRRVLFCSFSVAGGFDGSRERGTSGGVGTEKLPLALPRYKQHYEDPVRSAVHTTLDEFSLFRLPPHSMLEPIFV